MGITKQEFSDVRPYYITKIADYIIDYMSYGWDVVVNDKAGHYDITSMQLTTHFNAPEDWVGMSDGTKYKHVSAYWNAMDNAE